ncbi:GTP-binding domain-containing protein [Listeria riparia FSL S10-1204]|uniref:GTP-binding domain-containing protein n=1 Tax=Listeria riparia FSL S10-1204 TaxID=1265816 RepID=W7DCE8_9LIST|nr:GTP-binding domain-containing protein [Listeria riparia FSL S10-1204]
MNAMVSAHSTSTHKQVFEKDMLFATLETSVREIILPDKKQFLLTDTVGFVSKLPHHLVKAFRSTLEEAAMADVLIHVVDVSHEHFQAMMQTTEETLAEMDVVDIPVMYAFNKADMALNTIYPRRDGDTVYMSAKEQKGLDILVQMITEQVFGDYEVVTLHVPFERGDVVSYLNEHAEVLETAYEEEGTRIKVNAKQADRMKFNAFIEKENANRRRILNVSVIMRETIVKESKSYEKIPFKSNQCCCAPFYGLCVLVNETIKDDRIQYYIFQNRARARWFANFATIGSSW